MTGSLTCLAVWMGLSLAAPEPGSAPPPNDPVSVNKARRKAVSPDHMQEALTHFKRGNDLVSEGKLPDSIPEYKRTIELWEHPIFLYNLAIVFRELGMLLEAHERIEAAIHGGAELLEVLDEAIRIDQELEGLLARLEINCDDPGVMITMDGQRNVFTCPGRHQAWVVPGTHIVTGEKARAIPDLKFLTLRKGDRTSIRLQPRELPPAERPRHGSLPWFLMGIGAATAGLGGASHVLAWNDMNNVIENCTGGVKVPNGCDPAQESLGLKERAGVLQVAAIGCYIAGGVMLASGVILLYRDVSQLAPDPKHGSPVAIAPFLGPDSRGLVLTLGF